MSNPGYLSGTQIGPERNHAPDDSDDTSGLAPEMMELLLSGQTVWLKYDHNDKPIGCRLTTYISAVADDDGLLTAIESMLIATDNVAEKAAHFEVIREALHAAILAECERDSDAYAAAQKEAT